MSVPKKPTCTTKSYATAAYTSMTIRHTRAARNTTRNNWNQQSSLQRATAPAAALLKAARWKPRRYSACGVSRSTAMALPRRWNMEFRRAAVYQTVNTFSFGVFIQEIANGFHRPPAESAGLAAKGGSSLIGRG